MQALRLAHLVGIILWFGSAAVDIVLELTLARTSDAATQRVLMRFHKVVDLLIEGPAVLLTLIAGGGLLGHAGYLGFVAWPSWLSHKIAFGAVAAAANLICVVLVVKRARACEGLPKDTDPASSSTVRGYSRAVMITGIGVPFALMALWLGVMRGG